VSENYKLFKIIKQVGEKRLQTQIYRVN